MTNKDTQITENKIIELIADCNIDAWHKIESLLNIILWEAKHKKKNYIPFIIEKEKNII